MKSTAIKFGDQTDLCLSCFATTMLTSLAYCGYQTGQTWPYYLSLGRFLEWFLFRDYPHKYCTGGVGAHLAHQLITLDVNNREDCAKKFISNRCVLTVLSFISLLDIYNHDLSRWVGLGVFLGILAGGLVKEEADVKELVKGLVSNEEPEPLSSL